MSETATFREVIEEGKAIVARCEKIQPRQWGAEGATIELVKQVGDLARHVMAVEGYYGQRDDQQRYGADKKLIADELVDIFTGVIRLAEHYGIDFAGDIVEVRQAEDEWLKSKGV